MQTQIQYGPLARYVKFWVAHVPGMPGAFSPPPWVSDPEMHHGTCVAHVPWCMSGSLTSGFLWSRWRGKRSRYYRRMRNPRFCVYGKRPMVSMSQRNRNTRAYLPLPGHPQCLNENSRKWYELSSENSQWPLLLTWFNFNPSMDK